MKDPAVTFCKAFAILAMVLGHACYHTSVEAFVNMFHMPLFFFMSGFCFKKKYLDSPCLFVFRRVKGLWFPYITWGILFTCLQPTCCKLFLLPNSDILSTNDIIRDIWYMISRFYGHGVLLGGFWFLKALFWASIISYVFLKIVKNTWFCICLSITVGYLFFINGYTIPFVGISNEIFIYSVFYLLGYLFSSIGVDFFDIKKCIVSIVILLIATIYWPQTMQAAQFSKILPYFVSALLAIWTIYSFARYLYQRNAIRLIEN